MKQKNKLRTVLIVLLVLLLLGMLAGGILLWVRAEIRAARQREAEEYRFQSAEVTESRFLALLGESIELSASAVGGKGELTYEFYYMDGEEKVVIREKSPESSAVFTAEDYGLYNVYVKIDDESPMTGPITAVTRCGFAHKGIDVSFYQGNVDWEKVAAEGYDFAMLRTGFGKQGGQQDYKFEQNVLAAHNAGLKVGAYHFSYALTPEDAKAEAEYCLRILEPYRDLIDYPVAFDIELDEQQALSEEELTAVVEAFCSTIREGGYTPIIYTFDSWLIHHPGWSELQHYDIWTANWSDVPGDYSFVAWQYSNTGEVDGIRADVDLNYAFADYEDGRKLS